MKIQLHYSSVSRGGNPGAKPFVKIEKPQFAHYFSST